MWSLEITVQHCHIQSTMLYCKWTWILYCLIALSFMSIASGCVSLGAMLDALGMGTGKGPKIALPEGRLPICQRFGSSPLGYAKRPLDIHRAMYQNEKVLCQISKGRQGMFHKRGYENNGIILFLGIALGTFFFTRFASDAGIVFVVAIEV